ncbi:hypothetical protein ACHAPT_004160 [Fusarium lateritium]
MKSGTANSSLIPKPIEYNHALPSTSQSGNGQTSVTANIAEKKPQDQKMEPPLRSSSATYIPVSAESSLGKENLAAVDPQLVATNPAHPANVVVTAAVDEGKVIGIVVGEVEEATEGVRLVRKQAEVLQA